MLMVNQDIGNAFTGKQISQLEERKKNREEILSLPQERKVSNELPPSPFTTIPSRALSDINILRHPSALQVLCVLCSYVNGQSGTAFPNQSSIAKRLNRSQQAISRQLLLLSDWGYVKKIVKQNALRVKGRKGATWRVLYDPKVTDEDLISNTSDPRVEDNKVIETLEKIQPQVVKDKDQVTTSRGCVEIQHPEVVNNQSYRTNNINYKEISREMCKYYAYALDEKFKSRGQWRWDMRQEAIAEDISLNGITIEQWKKAVDKVIDYHLTNAKQPPFSLGYIKSMLIKKDKPRNTQELIKQLSVSLKANYIKPRGS